jgi:hypothetical protein
MAILEGNIVDNKKPPRKAGVLKGQIPLKLRLVDNLNSQSKLVVLWLE